MFQRVDSINQQMYTKIYSLNPQDLLRVLPAIDWTLLHVSILMMLNTTFMAIMIVTSKIWCMMLLLFGWWMMMIWLFGWYDDCLAFKSSRLRLKDDNEDDNYEEDDDDDDGDEEDDDDDGDDDDVWLV